MISKYGLEFDNSVIEHNINRLTNQIWKLIPMRENNESWKDQIEKVLVELLGLYEILQFDEDYLILLSNLEGLKVSDISFINYRSKVFESINLLRGSFKNAKSSLQ